MVHANILFYAIQTPLQGWRLWARHLMMVGIALLRLYSNLNGLLGDAATAGRGALVDETHLMSPYVSYRYSWEEGN